MEPIFWTDVGVAVETAASAAIVITDISKAAEGVVTYSGAPATAPEDGDIIVLRNVTGMSAVNDRAFRIADVDTVSKTFKLEGEDTTAYRTFKSGQAHVVTLDAEFRSVQEVAASGGDPVTASTSTIHVKQLKNAPVADNPVTFSFTNLLDPDDPGYVECRKAAKAKAKRVVVFTFSNGAQVMFVAIPSASGAPTGQAQGAVQTPVTLQCQGETTTLPPVI